MSDLDVSSVLAMLSAEWAEWDWFDAGPGEWWAVPRGGQSPSNRPLKSDEIAVLIFNPRCCATALILLASLRDGEDDVIEVDLHDPNSLQDLKEFLVRCLSKTST